VRCASSLVIAVQLLVTLSLGNACVPLDTTASCVWLSVLLIGGVLAVPNNAVVLINLLATRLTGLATAKLAGTKTVVKRDVSTVFTEQTVT
jgi:hypothetical protein